MYLNALIETSAMSSGACLQVHVTLLKAGSDLEQPGSKAYKAFSTSSSHSMSILRVSRDFGSIKANRNVV